jgi:pimeloyl-ACP methyl ester carboxylesterase
MSIIVVGNQMVHYEVFGRGRPVLFLHGWMGSWRYWFPTMEFVSQHFRTYSFDFWGFGDTRSQHAEENIRTYSDQVVRFLDTLGIDQIVLVGHSMGGMVAMQTALDHPDRVSQVVTVGAPFEGSSLSWLLKLTNRPRVAQTFARWPWLRRTAFGFFLGRSEDPSLQEMIEASVKSGAITLNSTIRSMLRTDLRPELPRLSVPALIVHGGRDDVVSPRQVKLFEQIPMADVMYMPRSRHFPFLDEATIFNEGLLHFLQPPPASHALPQHKAAPPPPLPPMRSASLAPPLLPERSALGEHHPGVSLPH